MTETPRPTEPPANPTDPQPTEKPGEASPAPGGATAPGQGATPPSVDEALAAAASGSAAFQHGSALSGAEALEIASDKRTTVIVLAGNVRSGKSTILASLYERFGRGPVGGQLFAGSRTLSGFERLCHRGRVGSGSDIAGMEHTPRDALPWLHLRIRRRGDAENARDLLLGDFSGEHFADLLAGRRAPADLPFLRRADHVALVLDGRNFARTVGRPAEERQSLDLTQVLVGDPSALANPAVITAVVTKWDLIHRAGASAEEAVQTTVEQMQRIVAAHDVGLALVRTAARSVIRDFPLGHGTDDLLNRWADRPVIQVLNSARLAPSRAMFDRYRAPGSHYAA